MASPVRLEGLDSVRAMIADLGPGLDRANKNAQNTMAYELMKAEKEQLKSALDRPTPYSVNSIAYKKVGQTSFMVKSGNQSATVQAGEIKGAGVFVTDIAKQSRAAAEDYLGVQAVGGKTAGPRPSEVFLQQQGFMPRGTVYVPASGAKFNAYGNIPGETIWSMMRDLANTNGRGQKFFVMGKGEKALGVYAKVEGQWMPFIWFKTPRDYQAKSGFYERAEAEVAANFGRILSEAVDYQLERMAR